MKPLQLWIEGYKFRCEACRQGGLVAGGLLAVLTAVHKKDTPLAGSELVAVVLLAIAVALSALAYLLLGMAIGRAAENCKGTADQEATVVSGSNLMGVSVPLMGAIWSGSIEIVALIFGLAFTLVSLTP